MVYSVRDDTHGKEAGVAFDDTWAILIRSKAAELGLNQADLGRSLGMSKQTGHRIWKGDLQPSAEQCDQLETILMLQEGELRVACGFLPAGDNPKVERTTNGIIVRLSLGILYITWRNGRPVVIWDSRSPQVLASPRRYLPEAA